LCAQKALTPDGKTWLLNALDMFADDERDPVGYPDPQANHTTVERIKVEKVITKDPAIVSSTQWDCHVHFLPFQKHSYGTDGVGLLGRSALREEGKLQNLRGGTTSKVALGLAAYSGPVGFDSMQLSTNAERIIDNEINIPRAKSFGLHRIVAAGFEIENVTPEIYQGGSVVAVNTPAVVTPRTYYEVGNIDGAAPYPQALTYLSSELPPGTVAKAIKYKSSRSWNAAEGAYVNLELNDMTNPMTQTFPCGIWLGAGWEEGFGVAGDTGFAEMPNSQGHLATHYNFNNTTVMLTGLSEQTALKITSHFDIERVPNSSQDELIQFTKKSPAYDPLAIKIYSLVKRDMPCACKVTMNPLGEWFEEVMRVIGDVAPTVGAALSPIFAPAGLIGNAAGAAAKAAAKANHQSRVNRQKKLTAGKKAGNKKR